jgi:hypothetical protein
MVDHPIVSVLVDGSNVNKGAFRDAMKKAVFAYGNAAAFRLYSLPDVTSAIIADDLYRYDPLDLVTADNGTTCIHDADGRRFKLNTLSVAGETIFRATAVGGTANDPEITTNGLATLSATPQLILVVFASSNSGAMTIKWDAQAAQALKSPGGSALANGEVLAGRPYLISVTSAEARIYMTGVTW